MADPEDKGIRCPRCGCRDMRDADSRLPVSAVSKWRVTKVVKGRGYIRRRRVCRNCGRIVYTKEKVESEKGKPGNEH